MSLGATGYDIPFSFANATPSQATAGGTFAVYTPIIIGAGSSAGNIGAQTANPSPILNAPATASTAQGGYAGANAPSPLLSSAGSSNQSYLILAGIVGLIVAGGAAYYFLK